MIKRKEKLVVVIVHYNSNGQLLDCVKSLLDLNCNIFIIDNASIDGTLEKCQKKYKNFTYIKNIENIGFAAAVNIGVKKAIKEHATHILLCNPDALVKKDCVTKLIKESNNEMGVYSPLIRHKKDNSIWFAQGYVNYSKQFATHKIPKKIPKNAYHCEYVSGCVMLINVEVFEKIGFLDERFFLYYEDVDFSLRAKKAGFCTKVVPNALALHDEQSEKMGDKKIYFLVLAGLKFFGKNTPLRRRALWIAYTLARFLVSFMKYKLKKAHSEAVWSAFKDYVYKGKKNTNFISNS